jgi:hypothetical protein
MDGMHKEEQDPLYFSVTTGFRGLFNGYRALRA